MSESDIRGRFVWYELLTSDPKQAIPFYTEVIGWGRQDWEGGQNYTMWTVNDAPIGGLMQMPEEAKAAGAPPHWLPYIGTPDTDATVKRAQKLGARVLKPADDIPTVGRFAVLADPQGAIFAVFTPESDMGGGEAGPSEGQFSWHELATTDFEAAFDFYRDLFGWEKTEAMDMGEAGIYQMYGRGGPPLGGIFNKTSDMPGPPAWLCYVMVADAAEGVERVKNNGGQVLVGPMEVPGGDQIAQCLDPQGAAFALHSRSAG